MRIYTQIDGLLQLKFRIVETGHTLRETQVSNFLKIFQVSTGYMHIIGN
jgi:lipopolysaccharide/colanic/teichoic acid biosynthesis glycosyltransferase